MIDNKKGILISTFVKKNNILTFLEHIKNEFDIPYEKIFVYEVENNINEYLVTFKIREKIVLTGIFEKSNIVHVKNGCIFSINALNRLIEIKAPTVSNFKEYQIDWNNYKDKLILLSKNGLNISKLTKINNFLIFFM